MTTDLGVPPGATQSHALAVNQKGQVAGYVSDEQSVTTACIWTGSRSTLLGTLPGHSRSGAADINSRGQVVGYSAGDGPNSPFLWQKGRMTNLNALLPPGSGDPLWGADSINDKGQVVGSGAAPGGYLLTP